jgi:hypothetical protein
MTRRAPGHRRVHATAPNYDPPPVTLAAEWRGSRTTVVATDFLSAYSAWNFALSPRPSPPLVDN